MVSQINAAHLLFDQPGDFSFMGKSPILDIQFGINQLVVALHIEDAAAAFDQLNV